MLQKSILSILFILFALNNIAQNNNSTNTSATKQGTINIKADPRLEKLVDKHKNLNKTSTKQGYRVQVSSSTDSENEKLVRATFMKSFPNIPTYIEYIQPNYIVQAGNYRTKFEAQELLDQIKLTYKAAFIIFCDIN